MEKRKTPPRILITGGSGLVGSALKARLAKDGAPIVELTHRERPDAFLWDAAGGETPPAGALENLRAVVHLAGAPIARRWTDAARREIRDSRVNGTHALAAALARLPPEARPEVFVSMSGTSVYGAHRPEPRLDEYASHARPGAEFLGDLARDWEAATEPARHAGIRTVTLRTGIALAKQGGALAMMLPAFKSGLGGRAGSGAQKLGWIALDDLVSLILFTLGNPVLSGAVNAVAPGVVTNAEFASALGRALHRPAILPAPAFALRALFGRMADETILADLAPYPGKALETGFTFAHPELPEALATILKKP